MIPAVLSFISGQAYLFYWLRRLDRYLESRSREEAADLTGEGDSSPADSVIK